MVYCTGDAAVLGSKEREIKEYEERRRRKEVMLQSESAKHRSCATLVAEKWPAVRGLERRPSALLSETTLSTAPQE